MITFLDEKDVEHGALATIKVTNAVNGERSLTGEIESGDYVLANIERGWRLRFDDEFYVVTYAKPIDDGKTTHVTFDAVHQFFWDFDKSSVHEQLNDGSHTFLNYLDFIFADSGYTYTIDPLLKVYTFEKQSFGYKSRLNLFNDIITASGVEFQVNGKVVRILEKTGTDLSTVVRKNFNMNELGIEKHIGDFVTYQKGFGAWVDENDHTKGRLVTEYTSPLASVYGKLEAEPLVDERYTQADNMIAALKANVDNSYSISVRLDMEDLTRAGYEYTQPRAGDYIMAINETLDFQEKIRIVSFTSEYDVTGQLIKHEVTCNDIGAVKKLSASYNLTKEQAQNASDSVGKAVEMANKALVSADGKSTVYFGNEFPKDEPKGTLHKGDSLYLTVGDTTKMYYWTGADWEELPIVNDVEAFKEQIADELKDVPNREEFEATITEKLATSKAEIKTQIDTAKTQAESNAKAYADEINQATAEVAEQANAAADALKTDLTKVKTDLTATTSTANSAETSASEAKQQITTVANDLSKAKTNLQNAVSAVDTKAMNLQSDLTKAKQDLQTSINSVDSKADGIQSNLTKAKTELNTAIAAVNTKATNLQTDVSNLNTSLSNTSKTVQSHVTALANQAKELQDQADQLTAQAEAQDALATRVETVETTANGTKSTVSELSKTVASNTNNITSVTNRTKTVETDLTSTKTSISELQTNLSSTQTGLTNLTKRTKDVEDDLSGTKTTLTELSQTVADDGETITGLTTKTATIESSVNGLKTSLTNTQKDLTSVTTRTKNVENDLAGTKTSLTSLSQTVAADGQTITSLSNKTKTIESNVDGLTTSLSNTQKDLTSVTNRTKTVEDTLDGTRTELAELQETVDTTNSNLASVTERTSTVESDLSGTKTSLSNLTKTVSDDGKTIASLSSQTKTIESTVSGLKTSLTSTQSDLAGITTRTKNVEDDLSGTKTELAELQTTVGTTNTDLANVTKRTKTVEDDLAGTKTSLSSLSQTVDNDGKNITSLTSRTKIVEDSVSGLTTTMTSVQQTLTSTTNRTKAVEDDLANTKTTLSATTTTANATKTNLANYQASNDKAVANLQSNLQTANGNISSLKTKVEAVPGQITSAVSAVEGKIPKSLGGRNLIIRSQIQNGYVDDAGNLVKTNGQFTIGFIDGTDNKQFTVTAPKLGDGLLTWFRLIKYDASKNFLGRELFMYTRDAKTVKNIDLADNVAYFKVSFDGAYGEPFKIERGSLATDWSPAPEDAIEEISSLSSQIQQTADGMTLLATKTELNAAKSDLQSGISTATSKADNAQATANNNAQTISKHTTQISALNTGLQAKVSQSDFNTLSGRVTTAENNITAKANELSSKITSVEGKIPSGEMNLIEYGRPDDSYNRYSGVNYVRHDYYYRGNYRCYALPNSTTNEVTFYTNRFKVERNTDYTLYFKGFADSKVRDMDVYYLARVKGSTSAWDGGQQLVKTRKLSSEHAEDVVITFNSGDYDEGIIRFDNNATTTDGQNAVLYFGDLSLKKGKSNNGWSPSLAELASSQDLKAAKSEIKQTTDAITASVSSVQTAASNAQSTANTAVSKADAAQAGVNTLDSTTVKSASLTINTDGIVMKAGKSTSDFANAVGSYFSVNQNAINLFSDKINVKGSMIVDGAVTSTKIASKSINTAHLNGKIITADVISSNAVTADAIKAGAVTTSAMSANSINGDRITAGTLDAAKIKAGSITASQIASGTITSSQIATGTISAGNIATGAITTDKIAANSINSDKIVSSGITANVIKGGKLQSLTNTTNFDLDTGKLFYNNNNTGVFRVEDGASTMGLKFSNTAITVNNTSRILSRVILGGDRRETTLDDGKWDQGGFTGIVAETINGVDSDQHAQADTLRVIGDNIYFTHSYNYDSLTSTSAQGWKMETFSPFSSYTGNVVLKPYGINYRQSDIITGDIRLDNGDGSGYWVRGCIRTLRNCFQHYLNGGTSSGAMNAIRDALREISGV